MHLTLRIVARTLFDADVTGGDAAAVGEAMGVLLHFSNTRMGRAIDLPRWLPTAEHRQRDHAIAMLDRIIMGIIDERRRSPEDRGDLLSMLLMAVDEEPEFGRYGAQMTDRQLRDEVMTLYLAGHETTANALTWTWYLLSQHPEVEARLHDELARVLGGRAPQFADLKALPYTEQVVKSSLRLYPPAWWWAASRSTR